jgi:hypothetical protein
VREASDSGLLGSVSVIERLAERTLVSPPGVLVEVL